jgi:hypothetical protein
MFLLFKKYGKSASQKFSLSLIFKHLYTKLDLTWGGGGGGVGFYVREGLTFKVVENLSPFEQKIFEAITIVIF